MFFQRLITTCILIPFVLFCIFWAPPWFVGCVFGVVVLLLARESLFLIPLLTYPRALAFLILLGLCCWAAGWWFTPWLWMGLAGWLLCLLAILTYPASAAYWGNRPVVALSFFLLLPVFMQSVMRIYALPQGQGTLLYLLSLVWAADTGAYGVGKGLGRHKLIPLVSPGKSWEGLFGAVLLACFVSALGYRYLGRGSLGPWLMQAVVTVLFSVVGDLFISVLKRRCRLKDTGTLLPGHGGLLDRLDSLLAAAPVFYWGLTYIL